MRRLLIGVILVSLLLVGCGPVIESVPEHEAPVRVVSPEELYDETWISPGKVNISNFHAGSRAEYPITIHNGEDEPAEFLIFYKESSKPNEGFITAPDIVRDWVIVTDPTPILLSKETRDILIILEMPRDTEVLELGWEFLIVVRDVGQVGMVQTELACRWKVSMRK